jgi:hypothetical protein
MPWTVVVGAPGKPILVNRPPLEEAAGGTVDVVVVADDLAAVVVGDVGRERGAGDLAERGESAVAVEEGARSFGWRSALPICVRADVREDAAGGRAWGVERREPTLLQHEHGNLGAGAGACCQNGAYKRHERHQNEDCDDG